MHDKVLDALEHELDAKFDGSFHAKALTGSLLWGFTAHDLQIRDKSGKPVARVDELRVDASVFEMLQGSVHFDHAQLVRPVFYVERDADGTKSIVDAFKARRTHARPSARPQPRARPRPRAPGKVVFEMTHAQIVDGKLIYRDDRPGKPTRSVSVGGLETTGKFRVLAGKRTVTEIDRLNADVTSTEIPEGHHVKLGRARVDTGPQRCAFGAARAVVDGRWHVDDLHVAVPRGDAAPGGERIELRGRASSSKAGWLGVKGYVDPSDKSYKLALKANAFEVARWPGAPDWSWLVLDGQGTLAGRGWSRDLMEARLHWAASNVELGGEHVDTLRLDAKVADKRLDIDKLDVEAGRSSVRAAGHLTESGAFVSTIKAHLRGGALTKVLEKVGLRRARAQKLRLAANATGTVDLSTGEPAGLLDHAHIDGKTVLDKLRVDDVRARRVTADFDLHGPFPLGKGSVGVSVRGLHTPDKKVELGRVKLRLLADRKYRLHAKSDVHLPLGVSLPVDLDTSGRYGRKLDALAVDKLVLGRSGMHWRIKKPGLVLIKDDAVALKSLTLRRSREKVRLDGTYGSGEKNSVADVLSRLKSAQLRSFLDLPADLVRGAHDKVLEPVGKGIKHVVVDDIGRGIQHIF